MSSAPAPGFQRRPPSPLASLSLAAATGCENVINTKAGQDRPAPPHGGRSGGAHSSPGPGEPLLTRNAPPGKSDCRSDSESGQRLPRALPGLGQREGSSGLAGRPGRRPGWWQRRAVREGPGGKGAEPAGARRREGEGRARACAARERARSPGRARGWLLLGVELGDSAR